MAHALTVLARLQVGVGVSVQGAGQEPAPHPTSPWQVGPGLPLPRGWSQARAHKWPVRALDVVSPGAEGPEQLGTGGLGAGTGRGGTLAWGPGPQP